MPIAFGTWRRALAGALLIACALPAAANRQIENELERAEELNVTAPVTEGWDVIRSLLAELDKATPRQRARIRLLAVRNLALQGKADEATVMARGLAEQTDYPDLRLSALRILANLDMNAGRFEAALSNLNQALDLLETVEAPSEAATLYGLASQFHGAAGDGERAIELALQALQNARMTGNARRECTALSRLSIAYQAAERIPEARDSARRALPICRASGDPVAVGLVLLQSADLSATSGELDRAETLVREAMASYSDSFLIGNIEARLVLARVMLFRNRPEAAIEQLEAVLPVAREQGRTDLLEAAYARRATAARQLGNLDEALEYTRLHMEAREAQLKRISSLQLAFAQVQFNVRMREQELALVREQARAIELENQAEKQRENLREFFMVIGIVILVLLVAWLIRVLRERSYFHRMSEIDGLTGLYNHSRFFSRADELVNQARDHERPFILVLADVDHFKQVNDQYGHQVGDQVLRSTARVISDQMGDGTVVGRIGGEEFAICMPDLTLPQAESRIGALRQRLANSTRRESDPAISMSFGIGTLRPGESMNELRSRVDQALYRAKHEGRDRVVVADDPYGAPDAPVNGVMA